MGNSSLDQKEKRPRWVQPLRTVRLLAGISSVFALALAFEVLHNTEGNPKTWSSVFRALASAGVLAPFSAWFAAAGVLLLMLCIVLTLVLEKTGNED